VDVGCEGVEPLLPGFVNAVVPLARVMGGKGREGGTYSLSSEISSFITCVP
jgi:hypothetical protein